MPKFFHNLGGISLLPPANSKQPRHPRLKSIHSEEDIAELGDIKVEPYIRPGGEGLRKIISEKKIEIKPSYTTHFSKL